MRSGASDDGKFNSYVLYAQGVDLEDSAIKTERAGKKEDAITMYDMLASPTRSRGKSLRIMNRQKQDGRNGCESGPPEEINALLYHCSRIGGRENHEKDF